MLVGSEPARPTIISEKNNPIDSTIPVFWNVARMPDAGAALRGREAVHDAGDVGGGEQARADAVQEEQDREDREREVGGQGHQRARR